MFCSCGFMLDEGSLRPNVSMVLQSTHIDASSKIKQTFHGNCAAVV